MRPHTVSECARRNPFRFSEQPHKIIHVRKATLKTDFCNGAALLDQELFGQPDALPVNVFQGCDTKLVLEPFKEHVAAQVCLTTKHIDRYLFGKVFVNIMQDVVQPALIVTMAGLSLDLAEVLALKQADEELL